MKKEKMYSWRKLHTIKSWCRCKETPAQENAIRFQGPKKRAYAEKIPFPHIFMNRHATNLTEQSQQIT